MLVMTEVARSDILRKSTFNEKGNGVARLLVETGGEGRSLHSFTSQLNLSRICHTCPCPPV